MEDPIINEVEQLAGYETPQGEAGEKSSKKDLKVAEILICLVLDSECKLFLDQLSEPHVVFPYQPAVAHPLRGGVFRKWLASQYWQTEGKGFSGEQFSQCQSALEGMCHSQNLKAELYNRVALVGNTITYDLGDNSNVVEITSRGWKVTGAKEALFRRLTHQKEQITPQKGGKITDILNFVNLDTSQERLLYLTYLPATFFVDIPRPQIVVTGEQGSAKSTLLKLTRSLIDPSRTPLLKLRSSDELALMAHHHFLLYLDNVGYLPHAVSDDLSAFITGSGFQKRQLFTDSEAIIYELKSAIGLSAISQVIERADLLDRSLIFSLSRIPDTKRRDEKLFWQEFEDAKPKLLGGLFDLLSATLRLLPEIKLDRKPRMADYSLIATAAAINLGKTGDDFLNAFSKNVEKQNSAAIDGSVVGQTILHFMQDKFEWEGSSSDLYEFLKKIAEKQGFKVGGNSFPSSSNWLWRKIVVIKPNLNSMGIVVEKIEEKFHNSIKMSKVAENASTTSYASTQPQKVEEADKNASTDASTASTKKGYASTDSSLNAEAEEAEEADLHTVEGSEDDEEEIENL